MSTNLPRRTRHSRPGTIRLAQEVSTDWREVFQYRAALVRIVVALAAMVIILCGIKAWRHAFPHRLGERPPDGVLAMVQFSRVNRELTQSARDRAADQAPLVFRFDSPAHDRIADNLKQDLQKLAAARNLEELPLNLRQLFGLADPGPQADRPSVNPSEKLDSFDRLKGLNDDKLAEIISDFQKFLQRVEKTGLIQPEHLPRERVGSTRALVRDADGGQQDVKLEELQLVNVLQPGGRLDPARWNVFPALGPMQTELETWLRRRSPETLVYDRVETQKRRQAARDETPVEFDVYNVGQTLVMPGEMIDELKLELLQAEYDALEAQIPLGERILRVVVVFLMLGVLAVLIGYHLVKHEPKLLWNLPRFIRYVALIVLGICIGRAVSFDPWRAEVGVVLTAVMVCAVVHNQVLATLTAFALSIVVTVACGADMARFAVMMSVCAAAVILLSGVPNRSTLVTVGGIAAAVCLLMHWGMLLVQSAGGNLLWRDINQWPLSLWSPLWCLAAGFLVSGSLPFIESWFGAVTDISLLELGDVSHPLLQELVHRAPGTYNHSISVASIGETAADSIGANGLLVRVGAYFHDIGKMLKPQYFIENSSGGVNRHENLAPAMSTLIIIGHVKDGVDLARQQGLPEPLIDFIEQHHGTTLVEYFYHEATRQAGEQPGHEHDVQESLFRYPGPKPQTREAAVLMIADAVEGASRALSEPTASRIERLVHDIVMKRLLDGQFSECGLTLTDLDKIEDSLTKSLIGMYHGRVKYPDQRSA
ncbi:MAG: HD family phosphohydrolase [Planctomycetaceae bacterium]|jgi:putative nucleotidyltransferase with HDIG domain